MFMGFEKVFALIGANEPCTVVDVCNSAMMPACAEHRDSTQHVMEDHVPLMRTLTMSKTENLESTNRTFLMT
jgi:hypothetical protein